MFLKSYSISFVGLFLVTFSAWAGTSAFDGVVKDPAGHPVKGADVRIEARNGSNFSRIVKTDATGHYTSDGLAVGIYKVTVVVNGAVKASILNASTQSGKPTQLNFELTPKTGTSKTHRVWIAADTGTHIGGGQWIDVDDNGNPVNNNGVSSVEKYRVIQPPARTTYRVGQ
jgi:Carboxypeptidase regulatory-like domain